jgi:hypothetical protein
MPDCCQFVLYGFDEEEKVFIDEEDLVFGMVDDIDQVFPGKTDIDGMQYGAVAGNAEIKFQVAVVVEGKAGHTVAFFYAQCLEGMGQLTGSLKVIGIAVSKYLIGIYRYYFFSGIEPGCP